MATYYPDNCLVVHSKAELEAAMFKYNCQTPEELDDKLYYVYGVYLKLDYEDAAE